MSSKGFAITSFEKMEELEMRKMIDKKSYDTETARQIGYKYVGDFGQADGYEERLFVKKTGEHFIYGVGGTESEYSEPVIKPLTDKQAKEWKKADNVQVIAENG